MTDIKSKKWIRNCVLMLIDEIKDFSKKEKDSISFRQKMAVKHDSFFSKFPGLFMLVVDDGINFDMKKLDEMLGLMEDVHTGDRDLDEVNREMGEQYFKDYVAPNIDMNKEKTNQ